MNEVFLITGTRKGIGKALAIHYLEKGNLVVGCSRNESSIEHPNYEHFALNVADEQSVVKMVRQISKKHKRIDVLINNAGVALMNHIVLTALTSTKNIFDTNFGGTFLLTREASKIMIKNNYGRIINFTTVAVPMQLAGEAAYASSKAAIETFTKISAKELGQYNITVNAIGPSPVYTDLIKLVPKNKIDELINHQTIKRFGEISDVLQVADFFVDKNSSFITGQIIYLGGIS
jgi:3-oxoacyl-[acyl-carrier protein] reductase